MLAEAARALPAVLLFVAAGLGLQALAPRPFEQGVAARLGFAFLLGAAWCGLLAWAAGYLLGVPLGAAPIAALASIPILLGAGVATVRARRLGRLRLRLRRPAPGAIVVGLVLGLATFALLANAVTEPVSDFDGRMTWGTAAKYLLASRSVLPEVLRDPDAYVIHPRYPILLPILQVAVVTLGGVEIESPAIRPFYVLFLPALAAAVWPTARRLGGAPGAALAMLLVAAAPALLWAKEGGANGTYSDLPLAAFLGGALALLLHPRALAEKWRGAAAGILLAATVGSKNEGLVLAATAVLGAVVVSRFGRRHRRAERTGPPLLAASIVGLAILLVLGWRSEIPNRNDEGYFESISAAGVARGLVGRAPVIVPEILSRTLAFEGWGATFWVAPFLLVAGRAGLRSRAGLVVLPVIVAELLQVLAAYAVVRRLEVISVTWDRFLLQMAVPLLFLLSAAAGVALRDSGWLPTGSRVAAQRPHSNRNTVASSSR